MNPDLKRLALTVRFKEYLLNRDISSRRVILAACVRYMEGVADEKRAQALVWLHTLVSLNNTLNAAERKEHLRYDACWDELHTDLVKSVAFMYMIESLGV